MKGEYKLSFMPQQLLLLASSFGAMLILARWITGNAFISSENILVKYGLFFGVPYMFSFGIALVLCGLLLSRMKIGEGKNVYLINRINTRLTDRNKWLFSFLSYFMQLELWLLQLIMLYTFSLIVAGKWAVHLVILMLFVLLIVNIQKSLSGYYIITFLFIVILLVTLTFVPIYYFVLNGAGKIYEGIRLYHPYLLYLKNTSIWSLTVVYFFIAIAQVLFDLSTWYNLSLIYKEKRKKALLTAGFITMLLSFSFTATLMIAIFKGPFGELEVLLFTLLYRDDAIWLNYLFGLFCILASLIGLYHSLRAISKARATSLRAWQKFLFIIFLCLTVFVIDYFSVLTILFFFGVIYLVLLPFILILLFSNWGFPKYSYLVIVLEIIIGEVLLWFGIPLLSIFIFITLPTSLCLLVYHWRSDGNS